MLLILLIATYLLSAFFNTAWIGDTQITLFTAVLALAIRDAPILHRQALRGAVIAVLVLSVAAVVIAEQEGGRVGHGIATLWAGLLLLLTVTLLVRQVLLMPVVTVQSIYGAISAYLIIGLMFASFYAAIYWFHGHFFAAGNANDNTTSDFQYFSFSTLTTLGYGDFTAAGSAGRAVAMLEAMSGQIFLATLVAKLVAAFRPAAQPGREVAQAGQDAEQ
jgi:Ion channel